METHISTYADSKTAAHNARLPLLKVIAHWIALARQRRQMRDLTPEQLMDMGVTRAQTEAEADRPFWDVPANWRG